MKNKLLSFILPILLFVATAHSQTVVDFGGYQLPAPYTNYYATDADLQLALFNTATVVPAPTTTSLYSNATFVSGPYGPAGYNLTFKASSATDARLYRSNPNISGYSSLTNTVQNPTLTDYDAGGYGGYNAISNAKNGRIQPNGSTSSGTNRFWSITLPAGETATFIIMSDATAGISPLIKLAVDAAAYTDNTPVNFKNLVPTEYKITNSDVVSHTYKFYSSNGKLSLFRVYFGDVSNVVSPFWYNGQWENGTPSATREAFIGAAGSTTPVNPTPNFTTTANGTFTAKKLTVNTGNTLTVNTGNNITVQDQVVINGTGIVTVESDANLIQVNNVTNTGNAVVKRNSNSLYRLDYTMWSSPVASQNLLAFSPATTTTRFYNYNSSTNLYNAVADPSTTPFTVGKGYLIRMPNTDPTTDYDAGTATLAYPGVFTGVLNNGDINLTGLTPGQYVAVGNPYPSNIKALDFINANLDALDGGTLYLWRKKNGEAIVTSAYATMNKTGVTVGVSTGDGGIFPNGYIAVGQGFITTVPPSGTIAFNNGMRTTTTATFLRTKAAAQIDRVWINLTNTDGAFSQMLVGYMDGATTGFDAGFDGKYINDAATALTSDIAGEEYVIQGRPTFSDTDVVNLNFKASAAGTYTIAKDHVDGLFATGQDIYLVDKTTGVETNLQKEAYTFTAAAGVNNTRFQLTYKTSGSLKVNDLAFDENSISVYKQNGVLNINAGNTTMKSVKVFDVTGRLLLEQKSVNATTTSLRNLAAVKQALLIQITSADNRVVTKKAIN